MANEEPQSTDRGASVPATRVVETITVSDLSPLREALASEVARQQTIFLSVDQDLVVASADRLRLRLQRYQDAVRARRSWEAPLGILASLIAALATSQFKDTLGVASQTWEAMFVIASLIFAGLLVWDLIRAFRSRHHTIESVIDSLRTEKLRPPGQPS